MSAVLCALLTCVTKNANNLANYVLVHTFRNMVHCRFKTVNLVIQNAPKSFSQYICLNVTLGGKKLNTMN